MAGFPQGSILGPLRFLLYIDDVVVDTSLYIIVDDPIQDAEQLNFDLAKTHRWADKWLVTFNPEKSECILVSRKYNKPYHATVLLNQIQIAEVISQTHLGIFFNVTPIVGFCNCSMFCCALLYVHSSFAIILIRKRERAGCFTLFVF